MFECSTDVQAFSSHCIEQHRRCGNSNHHSKEVQLKNKVKRKSNEKRETVILQSVLCENRVHIWFLSKRSAEQPNSFPIRHSHFDRTNFRFRLIPIFHLCLSFQKQSSSVYELNWFQECCSHGKKIVLKKGNNYNFIVYKPAVVVCFE